MAKVVDLGKLLQCATGWIVQWFSCLTVMRLTVWHYDGVYIYNDIYIYTVYCTICMLLIYVINYMSMSMCMCIYIIYIYKNNLFWGLIRWPDAELIASPLVSSLKAGCSGLYPSSRGGFVHARSTAVSQVSCADQWWEHGLSPGKIFDVIYCLWAWINMSLLMN
jgi:hypothetical protein